MTELKHGLGILRGKKKVKKKGFLMNNIVTQICGVSPEPLNVWKFSQDLP